MSRRSRRKTLSHADLEDFLCDLGENSDYIDSESAEALDHESITMPNADDGNSEKSIFESISDEQRVREFCKLLAAEQGKATDTLACMYGRMLMTATSYRILPARTMYPETFEHPPESLEAKKHLLLSLKPMITDAEAQRQFDTNQCQDFTRCTVGKCKNKSAAFEYTDIDMESIISSEEYEKRYLLHLSMLRGGDKASSELDSLGSSQNPRSPNKKCISAERKETAESHGNKNKQLNIVTGEDLEGGLKVFDLTSSKSKSKNNENVSDKDREARSDKVMNPPSQPKRKSRASILLPFFDDLESPVASPSPGMKGPRSQSRRMTLSPATTRSLMMEVIGDEGAIPCPFECPTPLPLTFSVYSEGIDIIPPRTGREAAEGPCTGPFQRSMPTQEQICRLNSPTGKAAVIELGHQQTGFGNRGFDSVCVPSFGSIGDTAVALPVEQAAVRRQDSSRALSERTNATREDRRGISSPTAECAVKTVPLTMIAEGDKMEEASSVQTNTAVNPCVDLTELSSLPLCTTATVRTNSTYCDELDALLDSESDDNSSTTSSTMPYSPSLSTSISSERSPSGSSSSPICLDHSCSPSSGSLSDFCTSTASTDAPYMNQEYPKSPQKTGGNRFPLEGSLDFIFSSSGTEDCSEVAMDDSEEELGRLNNSIAVRNKSTKKGKKREYEDQEPLSPRDTVVPWKCSPNQAILLEHSDRNIVPKDLCGSPIVMEVDPDLGFREGSSSTEEEHSEAKGMFKKSKVESSDEVTSFSPTSSPSKGPQDLEQNQERERERERAKGRDRERETVQTGSKAHIPNTERSGTEELCTSDVRAVACDSVGHHMVMEGSNCTVATRTGPSATTLKEAEMKARSRLGIRQEVAKWKYHWEVASYCAAQTAREARREE